MKRKINWRWIITRFILVLVGIFAMFVVQYIFFTLYISPT
jgi:uncharacterized membrane protein YgaE (UPF0421/DUF939 family)